MVSRAVSSGRGIAGLVRYLMHDQVRVGDRRPETSERVAWAEPVGGSPTRDVGLCVRIMQGVTADGAILKRLAGVSNRGRRLRDPYAHFMTSWPPGEVVSREHMLEVADRQLHALGCSDRLAIAIAHTDTDHAHFHLVICKVHPDTGRAASLHRSGLTLSRVAEEWEREHGGIVIENRVRRREAREAFAAEVAREMEGFEPDKSASRRKQAEQRRVAISKAATKARPLYPLPPMQRKRGAGRHPRTAAEKAEWVGVYREQHVASPPPAEGRSRRVALATSHRRRKIRGLERALSCQVDAGADPSRSSEPLPTLASAEAGRSCRAEAAAQARSSESLPALAPVQAGRSCRAEAAARPNEWLRTQEPSPMGRSCRVDAVARPSLPSEALPMLEPVPAGRSCRADAVAGPSQRQQTFTPEMAARLADLEELRAVDKRRRFFAVPAMSKIKEALPHAYEPYFDGRTYYGQRVLAVSDDTLRKVQQGLDHNTDTDRLARDAIEHLINDSRDAELRAAAETQARSIRDAIDSAVSTEKREQARKKLTGFFKTPSDDAVRVEAENHTELSPERYGELTRNAILESIDRLIEIIRQVCARLLHRERQDIPSADRPARPAGAAERMHRDRDDDRGGWER